MSAFRRPLLHLILFLAGLVLAASTWAQGPLRICQSDPARYGYRRALAQLILDKTSANGQPDRLVGWNGGQDPSQERCLALLRQREVDLVYLPPTEALLAEFDAIRFDIHQGMLGYRVLLIHRGRAADFARVRSLEDLRAFRAGFGQQWADFPMFELNRLPVVGAASATALLAMLNGGRFDYFHRGLHEAWAELAEHPELDQLMVEPSLALVYNFPVYFMFHKGNSALRERFERGIELVRADGSMQALFMREFGTVVQRAQLAKRRQIRIQHLLPADLPPIDTRLWLER